MDFGIAQRRALVCGASSGLGFECAAALAAEGAAVTLVARREQPLMEAVQRLRERGATADFVVADVACEAGRRRIAEALPDADILVNNAGYTDRSGLRHDLGSMKRMRSVIELDRLAGEPLDVLVNGTLIAHGEVVVVNEKFGIRLTDVISPSERIKKLR